jgi:flagellar hook protein FlgE
VATTSFQVDANLDSASALGSTFNTPLTVYDTLGTPQTLNIQYTNAGPNAAGDNTWTYSVTLPGSGATITGATGTLAFNSSGQLATAGTTVPAIGITGLTDGAANMSLTWNLNDSSGNPTITQQNSASALNTTPTQNGFAAGTLSGYSVLSDGTVEGQYSNGQTLALGQVAVANFANPQGLMQSADGNEQATSGSGAAVIGQAGVGGDGTITGGSVEYSNVNLSTEFANMIVAQQSYDANAKVLTTLDQVDQSTIQMVS